MKIAIAGAGGRMGRTLIEAVLADRELEPRLPRSTCRAARRSASEVGDITDHLRPGSVGGCDVLIDFTRPEGTLAHLRARAARW